MKVRAVCFFALLLGLVVGAGLWPDCAHAGEGVWNPWKARESAKREVILLGQMPDEDRLVASSQLLASGFPGVILWDSPDFVGPLKNFLQEFRPGSLFALGTFAGGQKELAQRSGVQLSAIHYSPRGIPREGWQALFPEAKRLVTVPAEPRRLLLQGAHLAGALRAPLVVLGDKTDAKAKLAEWSPREIFAVGVTAEWVQAAKKTRLYRLPDEAAIRLAHLEHRRSKLPIKTLVVANAADSAPGLGSLSTLAPWIALQKKAALLLTNDAGTDVNELVREAVKRPELAQADTVILVGNLKAIPMERRPNPMEGGRDEWIEMEPLTPEGAEPFSFAVGRLFHPDPAVIALTLARSRLLAGETTSAPKALVVSNPGGGLPLLETLSRNTVQELRHAGYDVSALIGEHVTRAEIRKLLPEQTIFLWEGHHSTLIGHYQVHQWPEPLKPSLVFLQSCLALAEPKALPFLERGAVGVIGSSTRTYSGSGGAFSLAYFDALAYEKQSLGGALRHAKNFMVAFVQLKEKRLGEDSKLGGANLRSAWAFTLWGDPTVKLPRPQPAEDGTSASAVRHQVKGNTIVVSLPEATHDKVTSGKFAAEMRPNARLAGLVRKDEEQHRLVPLVFTEVHLPRAPEGKTPRLRSRLPERNWVFCWDGRRRCGYLLMTPRAGDQEIRFQVAWE